MIFLNIRRCIRCRQYLEFSHLIGTRNYRPRVINGKAVIVRDDVIKLGSQWRFVGTRAPKEAMREFKARCL